MQKIDVDKIISGVRLDEKIGQMFMANICGGESVDLAKRNLRSSSRVQICVSRRHVMFNVSCSTGDEGYGIGPVSMTIFFKFSIN